MRSRRSPPRWIPSDGWRRHPGPGRAAPACWRLPGGASAEPDRADVMNDFTLFLGKFLTQGTAIASLAPSSRWLSRTTVRNIDWAHAAVLVELGAGTGPITRVIAAKARPDCRVVVLERDPDFARLLRQ